ncbi:MAG: hypothetical protein ABJQ29_04460 [Luteolibacter sp.]
MKKLIILAGALLVIIPLGTWWFSPDQVIMRRTKHLMEVLSLSEGSGGPLRQAKVFSMNAMLAPEVTLTIPGTSEANGTFDKEEMESAFSWICQNAKSANFHITEFRNVEVDGDQAVVWVTVEGYMQLAFLRPVDGTHDVIITWKKGGDGWRFEKVDWRSL